MDFVLAPLLFGLALAGIPVLVHLMMRQKAKRLPFPALLFLQKRHVSNARRLRLRHLLLLGLRVGLIAVLCLALARPRLFSEPLHISAEKPVAAILVFDTSPSMEYTRAGQTRLAQAQQQAREVLQALPEDSRVAVLDSAELVEEWQPSVGSARERIDNLRPVHAKPRLRRGNVSVTRQVELAYRMFDKLDQEAGDADPWPQVLYVFSDRARACWDGNEVQNLRRPLHLRAVFVDVGADDPRDLAVTRLELRDGDNQPQRVFVPGDRIQVEVTVEAAGPAGEAYRGVLRLQLKDGPALTRSVEVRPGTPRVERFELRAAEGPDAPGLAQGYHQLRVELDYKDDLPFDNVRYATFLIRESRPILVLADSPEDAAFLQLDLEYFRLFHCDVKPITAAGPMGKNDLSKYRVVCLFSVANPKDLWKRLTGYVQAGGGLLVVPGGNGWSPDSKAYEDQEAQEQLLPARLRLEDQQLVPKKDPGVPWADPLPAHPFLAPFREWERAGFDIDFFREEKLPRATFYWKVKPCAGAEVVVSYDDADKSPALVERTVGGGKVLLLTTAFDLQRDADQRKWHNYNESSFSRVLLNTAAGYLAGDYEKPTLDGLPGQAVTVKLPPGEQAPKYALLGLPAGADGGLERVQEKDAAARLEVDQAAAPGNYVVVDPQGKEVAAFSVNFFRDEWLLERADAAEIEKLFGPGSVVPVGHGDSLRGLLATRWPQPLELFPWLMIGVLLLLAAENLLSNLFYSRTPTARDSVPSAAPGGGAAPAGQPLPPRREAVVAAPAPQTRSAS